jgi:hypothetical protein
MVCLVVVFIFSIFLIYFSYKLLNLQVEIVLASVGSEVPATFSAAVVSLIPASAFVSLEPEERNLLT